MLLCFFLALGAAITTRSVLSRFMLPVALLGIVLSISRSSYAAVVFGFLAAALFVNKRLVKVMLGVGIVSMLVLGPLVFEAVAVRIAKVSAEGGDARFTYARKAIPVFGSAPFLGVGPGRFGGTVAQKYSSPIYSKFGFEFKQTWKTIDSFWIHLLIESGLLGLFLFLLLLGRILISCRKANQIPDLDPWVKGLLITTAMLHGAHFLINISSMALEANTTAAPLWIITGVTLSVCRGHLAAAKAEGGQLDS